MFSPCLRGFSPGTPTVQRHTVSRFRLIIDYYLEICRRVGFTKGKHVSLVEGKILEEQQVTIRGLFTNA